MQETQKTWVRLLGWNDPLKKEVATHSSILAWKTPLTEEPGGLQSLESQRMRHGLSDSHTHRKIVRCFRQRGSSTKTQMQEMTLDIGGKINNVVVV